MAFACPYPSKTVGLMGGFLTRLYGWPARAKREFERHRVFWTALSAARQLGSIRAVTTTRIDHAEDTPHPLGDRRSAPGRERVSKPA